MKKLFTLATAVLLIASCSEDVTNTNSNGNRYVVFSVTEGDMIQSQNAQTRSLDTSTMGEVKMVKVDTDFPSEEPLCLTITDEPFIRHTNTDVTRGTLFNRGDAEALSYGVTEYPEGQTNIANVMWANSNPTHIENLSPGVELFKAPQTWEYDAYEEFRQYDFYAYAPWVDNGSGRGITLSDNYQSITYNATGIAVGSQPDLMTARKWTSSYVGAIPLTFQHRLCAIQIKTGGTWATGYHVSAVQFQNVISSGSFDIDSDKDADWSSYGGKGTYDVTGFVQANANNTVIAGDANTWLMMVPQPLTDVKLNITLSDGSSNSSTITADVSTTSWKAGHTITYTVSPGNVSSMTVSYPSGSRRWSTGSGYVDGPVTSYTSGEQFGLFIVDKNNKIILSNGIATASSSGASPTLTLPAGFFYSKQYKYFIMYPYRSDLSTIVGGTYATTYALNCTNTATTAEAFFSNVITGWSVQADQSSIANFKGSDLQVAMLSSNNFAMSHQMGLAGITLNSATVYDNYTYTYTSTTNQGSPTRTGGNTWYASSTVNSSNKPYYASNTMAYIVKKPGVDAYTISATQSNVFSTYKETKRYAWSTTVAAIAGKGKYVSSSVSYAGPAYLQATWNIPFLRGIAVFTTPYVGKYQFECWGASGGNGYSTFYHDPQSKYNSSYRMATSKEQSDGSCYSYGGNGGYTQGTLSSVAQSRSFYICVGGGGTNTITYRTNFHPASPLYRVMAGGYNGGGNGEEYEKSVNQYCHYGGGGGGATHVATTSGLLSALSKAQVLMVAGAGGGGGGHEQKQTGGAGGNITGGSPKDDKYAFETALGGNQSAGGSWIDTHSGAAYDATSRASGGSWGAGGSNKHGVDGGGGGGGAGYYGGAGGFWGAGAGGSSYINGGYSGCSIQNNTYVFTGSSMTVGSSVSNKPTSDKNGYARITYTYIP